MKKLIIIILAIGLIIPTVALAAKKDKSDSIPATMPLVSYKPLAGSSDNEMLLTLDFGPHQDLTKNPTAFFNDMKGAINEGTDLGKTMYQELSSKVYGTWQTWTWRFRIQIRKWPNPAFGWPDIERQTLDVVGTVLKKFSKKK